jgi:hypothetical protein
VTLQTSLNIKPDWFMRVVKLWGCCECLHSRPCVCRLENGLNKLNKTQSEVDVLVENARAMALDVEQKVASANIFAEQVSYNLPPSGALGCRTLEGHCCAVTLTCIMAALAVRFVVYVVQVCTFVAITQAARCCLDFWCGQHVMMTMPVRPGLASGRR